jgi:hypothetical protein
MNAIVILTILILDITYFDYFCSFLRLKKSFFGFIWIKQTNLSYCLSISIESKNVKSDVRYMSYDKSHVISYVSDKAGIETFSYQGKLDQYCPRVLYLLSLYCLLWRQHLLSWLRITGFGISEQSRRKLRGHCGGIWRHDNG